MTTIEPYLEENKDRFLSELFELIRIPSISSQAEHKADMFRCAEKWKSLLLAAGADRAEIYETAGHPVTYGEKIISPSLPTVLVYGHMDVMPVDPIDLWHTDPFEPVIKDGKIVDKKELILPREIKNVIKCRNPRCITSIEQELPHIFVLADEEKEIYRCKYCEEKYGNKDKFKI